MSLGGPDSFGYAYNDSVPLSWQDTTSGADTGLTGDGQNNAIQVPCLFPSSITKIRIPACIFPLPAISVLPTMEIGRTVAAFLHQTCRIMSLPPIGVPPISAAAHGCIIPIAVRPRIAFLWWNGMI